MKNHLYLGIALSLLSANIHADIYAESVTTPADNQIETTQKPYALSDVFLSSPVHTFEVYFNALIVQPTGGNLQYAAEALPLPVISPHWEIYEIKTDYDFGFDVGLRGILHNTNTNLGINWERFHSTNSSSTHVASQNMIGPFFEIGPDATPYKNAQGKVDFHFDEINLDYGVFVNFGDRLQMNLFSGVSFARIKQDLMSKFSNDDGTIVRIIDVPSQFMGAGPQLGLDFAYRIVKGLQFVGDASISALVGTLKNSTTFKAYSPLLATLGAPSPNVQSTSVNNKTGVVPGIEGKLGLSYVYNFCKHYMVKLEAGYEAKVYVDAIQSVNIGSEVLTPPVAPDVIGVYARTFERTSSNFALAGPYIRIDLGF